MEGVNRSRGEALETVHHLFIARLKSYMTQEAYTELRSRYRECIRMLNGLERTLERKLPESERRWQVSEGGEAYDSLSCACPRGWPPISVSDTDT